MTLSFLPLPVRALWMCLCEVMGFELVGGNSLALWLYWMFPAAGNQSGERTGTLRSRAIYTDDWPSSASNHKLRLKNSSGSASKLAHESWHLRPSTSCTCTGRLGLALFKAKPSHAGSVRNHFVSEVAMQPTPLKSPDIFAIAETSQHCMHALGLCVRTCKILKTLVGSPWAFRSGITRHHT